MAGEEAEVGGDGWWGARSELPAAGTWPAK